MTTSLRFSALPPADLDRVRRRGVDDFGNELVVLVNQEEGGAPLRCCLTEAAVGERIALLAWRPAPRPGPYAEVGPVFIHPETCPGWSGDTYPPAFRHRRQIFRAYEAGGTPVEITMTEGAEAEAVLSRLLARPEVTHVHSRNVMAGCYMFSVASA